MEKVPIPIQQIINVFFEFSIKEKGTFHLIINSEGFNHLDSVLVIKSDTSITVYLQAIIYDNFPLNIGNRWTYAFNLRYLCGGDILYIDGAEDWEITDLEEASNDSILYKCQRNFNGIPIDARGPGNPDTSLVNISDEFVIVEDEDHNIHIKHPGYITENYIYNINEIIFQRYYTVNYPEEIEYLEDPWLLYRYKKYIGITFWKQFTGSGHCNTSSTWTLSDSFIQ